ncbi:CehA/McbA family metallohydrolase [Parvularcula sp. ZS-1/3]|uniref:CehA/McbA family metallohydrolase n=1 Tax=Parvularcula mediterranea TaxID=2732508 RepID=A0A7Y3RP84_9PROT|nr:CehA/McbA family metallohydrolase [Parvularcula mediterranea]NNU16857.1 CehA/McbA family metallohydrolase [Parvularcula mediterranea]
MVKQCLLAAASALAFYGAASAQWTNHYPKLDDFGHHVYLEQHELPIFAGSPTDPAEAPDGERIAFSAHGWIWILDIESGVATRLTKGPDMDARPRWSPDGKRLAFVRDEGDDTAVVVIDVASRREDIIDSAGIDLDPEFSRDGAYLFYSSAPEGRLSLFRRHLASGADEQLTDLPQVERNPRALANGNGLLYLHGGGALRGLRHRDFLTGSDELVVAETLAYHLTADVHPSLNLAVYTAPIDNAQHLFAVDLGQPRVRHRLTSGDAFALTPSFSGDGESVLFLTLDEDRQFEMMRVPTYGGAAEKVAIERWDYGASTGTLSIVTTDEEGQEVPARVVVTGPGGHPVASQDGPTFVDPNSGRRYFYTDGSAELTVPAGRYEVLAVRGPMTPVVSTSVRVGGRRTVEAELELSTVWDAEEAGYTSADYHVHLNGDGHLRAEHRHALAQMAGEDLDQLAPMSWNRWERRIDAPILGDITRKDGRTVWQGQEVRSHFHGHVGLLGNDEPFAPWFFGPRNPTLGNPDLTNGDVVDFAAEQNISATYVHPFSEDGDLMEMFLESPYPPELVPDGILADRLGIEIVCAWTPPLTNSAMWYRFLNIGRPVYAMSGTDGWVDFHRTPPMGTGRNYIPASTADAPAEILAAAMDGKGFVTTGPALVFEVAGVVPGGVTETGEAPFTLDLAAAMDVDRVEILINGEVVETFEGVTAGESQSYEGTLELTDGGWVAARAYTDEIKSDAWPTTHARPFAHSSPIWIGSVGSTDPDAEILAASELAAMLDAAEETMKRAYGDRYGPRLEARFTQARAALAEIGGQ